MAEIEARAAHYGLPRLRGRRAAAAAAAPPPPPPAATRALRGEHDRLESYARTALRMAFTRAATSLQPGGVSGARRGVSGLDPEWPSCERIAAARDLKHRPRAATRRPPTPAASPASPRSTVGERLLLGRRPAGACAS